MPLIKTPLLILLTLFALTTRAQYPFEKYPAIKYKEYKHWKLNFGERWADEHHSISFYTTIPRFFDKESLTIRMTTEDDSHDSYIRLYKGKKLIQKFPSELSFTSGDTSQPLRVADINGDSLKDIKLIISGHGCGLAAEYAQVIYLFSQPGNKFTKVSYTDMMEDNNRVERDMDGNGNFEIITKYLQGYKKHNYWVFNIYKFTDNKLINVNDKFDYPIMVQNLNRANYKPANFNKTILNKYSLKKPGHYFTP